MTFEEIVKSLTPEIHRNLRTALELGKWPDGRKLSSEQKEVCMQAVIYFENTTDFPEHERVGYLDRDRPTPCSQGVESPTSDGPVDEWVPGPDRRIEI